MCKIEIFGGKQTRTRGTGSSPSELLGTGLKLCVSDSQNWNLNFVKNWTPGILRTGTEI
jgi:hypothetical protein